MSVYIYLRRIYIEARDEGSQVVFTTGLGEMKMSGEGERRRQQYRGCPISLIGSPADRDLYFSDAGPPGDGTFQ